MKKEDDGLIITFDVVKGKKEKTYTIEITNFPDRGMAEGIKELLVNALTALIRETSPIVPLCEDKKCGKSKKK